MRVNYEFVTLITLDKIVPTVACAVWAFSPNYSINKGSFTVIFTVFPVTQMRRVKKTKKTFRIKLNKFDEILFFPGRQE